MRQIYKSTLVAVTGLYISAVSLFTLLLLVTAIYVALLRVPLAQGPGTWQAAKIVLGGGLMLLVPLAWLAVVVFTFDYFSKGLKAGVLAQRFTLLAAICTYSLPLAVVIYALVFPSAMVGLRLALPVPDVRVDWIIAGGGALLGTLMLWFHCALRKRPS